MARQRYNKSNRYVMKFWSISIEINFFDICSPKNRDEHRQMRLRCTIRCDWKCTFLLFICILTCLHCKTNLISFGESETRICFTQQMATNVFVTGIARFGQLTDSLVTIRRHFDSSSLSSSSERCNHRHPWMRRTEKHREPQSKLWSFVRFEASHSLKNED